MTIDITGKHWSFQIPRLLGPTDTWWAPVTTTQARPRHESEGDTTAPLLAIHQTERDIHDFAIAFYGAPHERDIL